MLHARNDTVYMSLSLSVALQLFFAAHDRSSKCVQVVLALQSLDCTVAHWIWQHIQPAWWFFASLLDFDELVLMHFNAKARFWVGYLVAERWKAKFRGCLLIFTQKHQRVENPEVPLPPKRRIKHCQWFCHLLTTVLCHPTERYEQSSTTYECQSVFQFWFWSFLIDPDPPARLSTFEFGTLDIMLTLLVSAAGIRVTCLLNVISPCPLF